jgi:5'-deoxynucleotidase YfbR-like HD superfamily hydrolase
MGTMLTNTGQYVHFTRLADHQYTIQEIAAALSKICRYTGHCREFYSVAQHCVYASQMVPQYGLTALLHDASEAYLGDVSTHLKALLSDYKGLEEECERAIAETFGIPYPYPPEVKEADMRLLITEKQQLMPTTAECKFHWPNIQPYPFTIVPMSPKDAEAAFLRRFKELTEI